MIYSALSRLSTQLAKLPGDQFPPRISPEMDEWQVEHTIDYHLNNEDDESENTYFLMLKLTCDGNNLRPSFSLQKFVQDVGTTELVDFPIDQPERWSPLLRESVDAHDLHKDAMTTGMAFFDVITPFINALRAAA
jgi:hypothetical protein